MKFKFRIHFEWNNGYQDCIEIEGETLKELREIAKKEKEKRNPDNAWSERIKD